MVLAVLAVLVLVVGFIHTASRINKRRIKISSSSGNAIPPGDGVSSRTVKAVRNEPASLLLIINFKLRITLND